MGEPSDLIRAIQQGDSRRFEELVAPYLPRLRAEIYGITRDASEVDDLLQDTLLRAWRALPGYQEDGKFESWLRTIARNVGLNEVRRRIARSIAQTTSIEEDEPPPSRVTPEDDVAARERLAQIERLFAELPPEQKEVFVLHLLSGMSFKDIAERQDVSINTALGRMHRVRQKFARLLRGLWYGVPARLRPWLVATAAVIAIAAVALWARSGPPPTALDPAPDAAAVAAAAAAPAPDPPPWYADFEFAAVGAIGYWPQDLDPHDATGTWPDGEWTAGERVPGRFGAAWRLRPGRFYEVPIPPRLQQLEQYTTAAWLWSDPGHFEDAGQVIGIGQDPHLGRQLTMWVATPGPDRVIVSCSAAGQSGTALQGLDPAPDWYGDWRHIACTYDAERGMRLYIDGAVVTPPPVNGDGTPYVGDPQWRGPVELAGARAPLRFNKSGWDNETHVGEASRLSGIVDELLLFDRALSAEEIAALATDADDNGRADFWDAAIAAAGSDRTPQ